MSTTEGSAATIQSVGPTLDRRFTLLVLPLIALLFAVIQINRSQFCGSLSMPVTYDDCGYYYKAALLSDILKQQGPMAFLKLFCHPDYLYAPGPTAVCVLAFSTLGYAEWGPRLLNSGLVYALLLFLGYQARTLSWLGRLLIIGVALASPIVAHLILDSEGNVVCGLGTAAAVVLILRGPWLSGERKDWLKVGAIAGFSLLFRPHALPLVGALVMLASLLTLLTEWSARARFWKASGMWMGGLSCVMLPYFVFALPQFIAYYSSTVFGKNRDRWTYKGGLWDHVWYYFSDAVRQLTMGSWLWPCLATLALAAGVCAARRDRGALLRAGSYGLVMVATWAALTIETAKIYLYGYMLYAPLMVGCLMALIYILDRSSLMGRGIRYGLGSVCGLLGACWLLGYSWPEPAYSWEQRHQHQTMMANVVQAIQSDGRESCQVYFATLGAYLNPYSLWFNLDQSGRSVLAVSREHTSDVAVHKELIDTADWIVALGADNPSRLGMFADNAIHDQLRSVLDADPALTRQEFRFSPEQGSVFLYRRDRSKPPYPFCGIRFLEGFSAVGSSLGLPGPPNHFLTRLKGARISRLIYSWENTSTAQVQIPASGTVVLRVSCFTYAAEELTISLDDQKLRQRWTVGPDLTSWEVPLQGVAGTHRLSFVGSKPGAIGFTRLQAVER